jgi:cold shock CspA family protein
MNGYGFIAPADGVPGRDIFFHISDFAADAEPAVGLRVEYTVGESRSGKPRAVSVAPIPPAA